jgi:hypothetical protein
VKHLVVEDTDRTWCGQQASPGDQQGLEGGIHGVDCPECRREVSKIVSHFLKALQSPD